MRAAARARARLDPSALRPPRASHSIAPHHPHPSPPHTPRPSPSLPRPPPLARCATEPGVNATAPASPEEQTLYFCRAFGLRACAVPLPPPPSPPPPPPPPLSAACKAEVRHDCPVAPIACASCVPAHKSDLIRAGCPVGKGAAVAMISYCQAQAALRRDEMSYYALVDRDERFKGRLSQVD